jgi:hypothetical protein
MSMQLESDHSLTTPQGNNCLKLLRLIYPAVESLRKVKIDGPNNTKIHILANPKDEQLFDIELRSVVRTRIPIIEEITTQRRSTRSLLDRISPRTSQLTLFGEEKSLKWKNKKDISFHDLSLDEITYLEKLAKWELPD